MTDAEKLEVIETHLTTHHLEYEGGYPRPSRWMGDMLVVATGSDGDLSITSYKVDDLLAWYDRAAAYHADSIKQGYTSDIEGALLEVEQPPEVP